MSERARVGPWATRATRPAPRSSRAAGPGGCSDGRYDAPHQRIDGSVARVTVLFSTHAAYLEHLAGPHHPERPARLEAVLEGARRADLVDALVPLEPIAATRADLERVHPAEYLDRIEAICRAGGGRLDPDTYASARLVGRGDARRGRRAHRRRGARRGEARRRVLRRSPARAPRHADESMGFCLHLQRRGRRRGARRSGRAGADPRLRRASRQRHAGRRSTTTRACCSCQLHQWPLYPGTGARRRDRRRRRARHHDEHPVAARAPPATSTCRAIDEVVAPGRRALRPDVDDHLRRLRRPPRRSDHRARPVRRRLRPAHRSGCSRSCPPGGAS